MTNATSKKPKTRRTKVRAVQQMFYDNRIVEEGEVFLYVGSPLPSDEIAVRVGDEVPIGIAPPPGASPDGGAPPIYTTKGFVDAANRNAGRSEED